MRTVQHPIHAPASTHDALHHTRVYILHGLDGRHLAIDYRLIGNDHDA
jgi:hypothetical protein